MLVIIASCWIIKFTQQTCQSQARRKARRAPHTPGIGRHRIHQKNKKENETKIEEIFSGNNKANLKEIDEEKTKKKSKQNIIIKINLFASNLKKIIYVKELTMKKKENRTKFNCNALKKTVISQNKPNTTGN